MTEKQKPAVAYSKQIFFRGTPAGDMANEEVAAFVADMINEQCALIEQRNRDHTSDTIGRLLSTLIVIMLATVCGAADIAKGQDTFFALLAWPVMAACVIISIWKKRV